MAERCSCVRGKITTKASSSRVIKASVFFRVGLLFADRLRGTHFRFITRRFSREFHSCDFFLHVVFFVFLSHVLAKHQPAERLVKIGSVSQSRICELFAMTVQRMKSVTSKNINRRIPVLEIV